MEHNRPEHHYTSLLCPYFTLCPNKYTEQNRTLQNSIRHCSTEKSSTKQECSSGTVHTSDLAQPDPALLATGLSKADYTAAKYIVLQTVKCTVQLLQTMVWYVQCCTQYRVVPEVQEKCIFFLNIIIWSKVSKLKISIICLGIFNDLLYFNPVFCNVEEKKKNPIKLVFKIYFVTHGEMPHYTQ